MTSMKQLVFVLAVFSILPGQPFAADLQTGDLVASAKLGDGHAVHRLIEQETDLGVRGRMGYTALHWAGVRGNWRIFEELIAAGAPVNAVGSDGGGPLHWACHHDRADMVKLLLDSGATINLSNRWGRAPLHVAARRGCLAVADLLLERGADPNARTKEGWTPLHVAAQSGHAEMMALLKERGAETDLGDAQGLVAASYWRERPPEITLDGESLEDFVGLYNLGGGLTAKVWREEDDLRFREFAPDDLYPIGRDSFYCRQEPWRIRFHRNVAGAVESVEIDFLRRTVSGQKTASPLYVGSKTCMGCHIDPDHGNQYLTWLRSRHAHAFWRLGADWARFLGRLRPQYRDLERPIEDQRCLLCHVTGNLDDDALLADSFRVEEGVGCESCHGPGSSYMDPAVMADRAAFLEHGGRVPDENTCSGCHRNPDAFDWDEKWPKIAHGRPTEARSLEPSH